MSNFLDSCNPVKQREGQGGYQDSQYNDWEEDCFKKLVEKHKGEYKDKILKWLGHGYSETNTHTQIQPVTVSQKSESFSPGETAGIGAGAAVGGAGLVLTLPVLSKWLMRLF